MNFGDKVRHARLMARYSQRQLSDLTGIALRTIQNYESGARLPKQRESYRQLAKALNIEEDVLLDDNAEFVMKASEEYGRRGSIQAAKLVEEVRGLYTGGELADEDMDAMMQAIQDAYWLAKKKNRKYVPHRYRPNPGE